MKAIILAAGRGSRLKEHTDAKPKCLVPILQKPLVTLQIKALRSAGVDVISIVRGYRKELLSFPEIAVFDNPRWSETNMVMSLACADAWLTKESCIVSYSDIVYLPDHVRTLAAASGDIVITVDLTWQQLWEARFSSPLLDAETLRFNPDGTLKEIGARPESIEAVEGQYMGLLKISPEGWRTISRFLARIDTAERDRMDMTTLLSRLIAEGVPIGTATVSGEWLEVDNETDLNVYESTYLRTQAKRLHDFIVLPQ
jgi:L-glutamine-phosphate cytidylyltransferase